MRKTRKVLDEEWEHRACNWCGLEQCNWGAKKFFWHWREVTVQDDEVYDFCSLKCEKDWGLWGDLILEKDLKWTTS